MNKGLIFVMSAPAGTGKTTLVRMLMQEFSRVVESVSFTTRLPRPNEIPDKDYHFITNAEFEEKIRTGDFLEYAKVFDYYYGTSRKLLDSYREAGKHVILVIDTQGAMQLKGHLDAVFIFISPPNLDELRARLVGRQTDSPEVIEKRLSWAEKEISQHVSYNYHIVNDSLQTAYDALRSILIAEEHKIR